MNTWAKGDATGLAIPADLATLRAGGAEWLTGAFRAMGTLAADRHVAAITHCEPFHGGGTGAKALLSVRYAGADAEPLVEDLFVKFSRNFDDAAMDAPRAIMLPEVRLAALSREAGFPVEVPACRFADFEEASGTGVLITRRIAFGEGGIEPQLAKCMDHLMPEPLAHYRTLLTALARLAGTHKAGRLPAGVEQAFPFELEKALAADRLPWDAGQRANRVARYAAFAREFPQLLPEEIRTEAFFTRFARAFEHHAAHEDAIARRRHADPRLIALCHWNANSDNAWYWRAPDGELRCGLLDWGNVGQIPLAMALWGCLSSAPAWFWRSHLDALLALFASEYAVAGGPRVEPALLRQHLSLTVMTMGLRWLLDAPPRIRREVPDLALASGPLDPRILASETARVQLQMLTNFLAFAVA